MGFIIGLFAWLAIFALLLVTVIFVVLALAIGGVIGIFLFGDVIICICIIVWLIKKYVLKRK